MAIGNLGSLITFEVSSNKVLTFDGLSQTVSGRWAQHDIIGNKPVSEYLGPGQRSLSFDIYLSSSHGVKPRKTLETIEKAAESGEPFTFVVGGKTIGKNKWVIASASETWDKVMNGGNLVSAKLKLTLSEYV